MQVSHAPLFVSAAVAAGKDNALLAVGITALGLLSVARHSYSFLGPYERLVMITVAGLLVGWLLQKDERLDSFDMWLGVIAGISFLISVYYYQISQCKSYESSHIVWHLLSGTWLLQYVIRHELT